MTGMGADAGRASDTVRSHVDEDTGHGYDYRPGEILVATRDLGLVADRLQRERAQLARELRGMLLFRIPPESDVPAVVERLRSVKPGPVVAANRVFPFAPHGIWDPATAAQAVDEKLPPLPKQDGRLPGTGIKVGVVDTGLARHAWHESRAQRARKGTADAEELHENQPDVLDFEAGHGTFVAGIILQCAPGAKVFVYGAHDTDGRLDHASLNEAIEFLVRERDVDVLNFSFGGFSEESAPDLPLMQQTLRLAKTFKRNLVMVAAAGNHEDPAQPEPGRFFPAADRGVIGVGALDRDGEKKADFSNEGDWVDCMAIGEDILSTHLYWNGLACRTSPRRGHSHHGTSVEHVEPVTEKVHFKGWARWSGTSFAAPQVAGAIAASMSPGDGARRDVDVAVRDVVPTGGYRIGPSVVKANVPNIPGLPRAR